MPQRPYVIDEMISAKSIAARIEECDPSYRNDLQAALDFAERPAADEPTARALRARLAAEGYSEPRLDDEVSVFDAALEDAVKRFQENHQLDADGVTGENRSPSTTTKFASLPGSIVPNALRLPSRSTQCRATSFSV